MDLTKYLREEKPYDARKQDAITHKQSIFIRTFALYIRNQFSLGVPYDWVLVYIELHLSPSVHRLTQPHKLTRSLESHTPGVAGWTVVSKYDGWPVTQRGEWMMESVRARNTGGALRFQTSRRLSRILTSELKPGWFECGFVLSQNPSNWVNSLSECCVLNPSELCSDPSDMNSPAIFQMVACGRTLQTLEKTKRQKIQVL